jgi:uncharacterized coiled-coil DUF342 family protein
VTALVALLGGVRATVFAGLLAVALGWGGWQANAAGNARKEADNARAELDAANQRVSGYRALLADVNDTADAEIAEAKRQAIAGKKAADEAREKAKTLAGQLAVAEYALQEAKSDPTCAEQLRMQLCPAIPLL